jgi:phospholipid/cholesterol/gamma-HCH transport system ATP-binding protein
VLPDRDYACLISATRIVGQGTPQQLQSTDNPEVRQFTRGEPDGPVPFHYAAPSIEEDYGLRP